METEQDPRRQAQTASGDRGVAPGRPATLGTLLTQMKALSEVLPGVVLAKRAESLALDAEIEAGFDNMPV